MKNAAIDSQQLSNALYRLSAELNFCKKSPMAATVHSLAVIATRPPGATQAHL
jgi:hypothetical protein